MYQEFRLKFGNVSNIIMFGSLLTSFKVKSFFGGIAEEIGSSLNQVNLSKSLICTVEKNHLRAI